MLWGRLPMVMMMAFFAPTLAGCTLINAYEDPPIVGKWNDELNNSMDIELEGDGDGTFIAFLNGEPNTTTMRYDLEWEQSSEDEFEIELDCRKSSHPQGLCINSFKLRCDMNSDGDELDCVDKSGAWTPGKFEFKD